MQHERIMQCCLELASRAHGRTAPNPLVGAVVVDEAGNRLGEGYHHRAGDPHAEVHALKSAGEAAVDQTLFINLEPCSHYGKTPPCADAVIASGVRKVVVGMIDPNPKVAGQGLQKLREAGVEVEVGVLERECRWLNRGFLKRIGQQLPWVHLKMAVTLDGRIADRSGASRWISGPEARIYVHSLRNTCDAVLVGGATAAVDDPELSVRDIEGGRDPRKVIIDPQLKVRPDSRVFKQGRTTVFTSEAHLSAQSSFGDNADLVAVAATFDGLNLADVLQRLAADGVNEVLCEGGGRLAAALLEMDLVDEVHWFVAPKLLVDADAVPSLGGTRARTIANALTLESVQTRQLGNDTLIHGLLRAFV